MPKKKEIRLFNDVFVKFLLQRGRLTKDDSLVFCGQHVCELFFLGATEVDFAQFSRQFYCF